MNENVWPLILLGGGLLAFLLVVSFLSKNYSLNNFKNKTVGDGQHGTARWATPKEIHTTYHVVPFRPRRWRKGEDLPTVQGIILGSIIAPIAGIARVCAQPAWLCASARRKSPAGAGLFLIDMVEWARVMKRCWNAGKWIEIW